MSSWALATSISSMTLRSDQLAATITPVLQAAVIPTEVTSVMANPTQPMAWTVSSNPYMRPHMPLRNSYPQLGYPPPYMGMYMATAWMVTYNYPYPSYAPPPLAASSTAMAQPVPPVVISSTAEIPSEPTTSAASVRVVCAMHPFPKDWGWKLVPLRTQRADPSSKVNTRVGEWAFSSRFPIYHKSGRGELGLRETSSQHQGSSHQEGAIMFCGVPMEHKLWIQILFLPLGNRSVA